MEEDRPAGRAWIGIAADAADPRAPDGAADGMHGALRPAFAELRLPHRWAPVPSSAPRPSAPDAHATPTAVAVAAPTELAHELAAVADPGPVVARLVAAAVAAAGPSVLLAVRVPVPFAIERDDDLLARILRAWPPTLRLALELADPTWDDDAVHALLRAYGVALVATDPGGDEAPVVRRIASFLYVRLAGREPDGDALGQWAARLEPFLADGVDALVVTRSAAAAAGLAARLAACT